MTEIVFDEDEGTVLQDDELIGTVWQMHSVLGTCPIIVSGLEVHVPGQRRLPKVHGNGSTPQKRP